MPSSREIVHQVSTTGERGGEQQQHHEDHERRTEARHRGDLADCRRGRELRLEFGNLRARGFASSIIDQKGGLYRVAIGSYPDRELAEDALHAVREEEAPEAWMLKR